MGDIKIIKDLKPWEVMKRASEDDDVRVAAMYRGSAVGLIREEKNPTWDWLGNIYFIIDTTTPEIDWDKFDWDFFNQDGFNGLPVKWLVLRFAASAENIKRTKLGATIRESPFYYWAGGEQPVPDNIEVEVVLRNGTTHTGRAVSWDNAWKDGAINLSSDFDKDIVGFKLTGRAL